MQKRRRKTYSTETFSFCTLEEKVFWKLHKRYILQKKETTLKWISGVSTEMVLQISSPEKVLQKWLYRKGFIFKSFLKNWRQQRFEQKHSAEKVFLKSTQQRFLHVYIFFIGLASFWRYRKNFLLSALTASFEEL